MATNDQVRSEIEGAIATLVRRHGSTSDEDEKRSILEAIEELNGEVTLLNQAALLQAASSIATATEVLERAVGAARLGPFDGYLSAIESHLTKLNKLSGKIHAREGLESADVGVPKGATRGARKTATRGSTSRGAATRGAPSRGASRGAAALEPEAEISTSIVFADLKDEYQRSFDRCTLRDEFRGNLAYYLKRLRQGQPNYELVQHELGVPWPFVGIIHAMECGFNFAGHLHNGDPLTARTVHVPKGQPRTGTPPFTWLQSAVDALRLKKLDQIDDWSVPRMLYLLEAYNGFGYRRRSLPSPYLWSFSNLYDKGKFVKDGKFDPNAVSKQCGAGLMLKAVLST
jgi:lysozyme family protein